MVCCIAFATVIGLLRRLFVPGALRDPGVAPFPPGAVVESSGPPPSRTQLSSSTNPTTRPVFRVGARALSTPDVKGI